MQSIVLATDGSAYGGTAAQFVAGRKLCPVVLVRPKATTA